MLDFFAFIASTWKWRRTVEEIHFEDTLMNSYHKVWSFAWGEVWDFWWNWKQFWMKPRKIYIYFGSYSFFHKFRLIFQSRGSRWHSRFCCLLLFVETQNLIRKFSSYFRREIFRRHIFQFFHKARHWHSKNRFETNTFSKLHRMLCLEVQSRDTSNKVPGDSWWTISCILELNRWQSKLKILKWNFWNFL